VAEWSRASAVYEEASSRVSLVPYTTSETVVKTVN